MSEYLWLFTRKNVYPCHKIKQQPSQKSIEIQFCFILYIVYEYKKIYINQNEASVSLSKLKETKESN